MKNIEAFENLNWYDASLKDLQYEDGCLNIVMKDYFSTKYDWRDMFVRRKHWFFKYVKITIKEINYLEVCMSTCIGNKYQNIETYVFGEPGNEEPLFFEGGLTPETSWNNPFGDTGNASLWLSIDFEANYISVKKDDEIHVV